MFFEIRLDEIEHMPGYRTPMQINAIHDRKSIICNRYCSLKAKIFHFMENIFHRVKIIQVPVYPINTTPLLGNLNNELLLRWLILLVDLKAFLWSILRMASYLALLALPGWLNVFPF